MRKITLGILIGAAVLVIFGGVMAGKPADTLGNPDGPSSFSLPDTAKQVAPGVFDLGTAVHQGKTVQGYAFIDYRKGFKKSGCNNDGKCQGWEDPTCEDCTDGGNGNGGGGDTSKCYGFLAKGAKWRTAESWVMNPSNKEDLNEVDLFGIQGAALEKWEDAADGTVGDESSVEIFGSGTTTSETLVANTESMDKKNEVYFDDIADSNAIAVTIIWGIFKGPPGQRELLEWDQVYDDVTFDWSTDCTTEDCTKKMDFDNIATHEDGHSGGMDDLYEDKCSEQTMYGYAINGETKKRSLEDGDINGVQELYK